MTETITLLTFEQLNDTQKQILAQRLASEDIISLETTIVEFILSVTDSGDCDHEAPFTRDDIINDDYYSTVVIENIEYYLTYEDAQEKIQEYSELYYSAIDNNDEKKENYYKSIIDDLECLDFDEYPEVYEWYRVTPFFTDILKEKGEVVLDGTYWGRQTSGQSICLDYVIQCIAFDVYSNDDNLIDADYLKRD